MPFQLEPGISGRRVGVVKEGFNGCEDDVVKVVRNAIDMMAKAGAIVEEVSIPMHLDGKS